MEVVAAGIIVAGAIKEVAALIAEAASAVEVVTAVIIAEVI